jgi:hypothetical protein
MHFVVLLLAVSILIQPGAWAAKCPTQVKPKALLAETLKNNSFQVYRGLDDYDDLLEFHFIPLLERVSSLGKRWLNVGGGAARAEMQFFTDPRFIGKKRALSVSIARPQDAELDAFRSAHPKRDYDYVESPIETLTLAAAGGQEFLLTSDVLAASQYAPSLDGVIRSLIRLTEVGGDILIQLSVSYHDFITIEGGKRVRVDYDSVKIHGEAGNEVSIPEWLETGSGFQIVEAHSTSPRGDKRRGENLFLHLRRTAKRFKLTALEPQGEPKAGLIPPNLYLPERTYLIRK